MPSFWPFWKTVLPSQRASATQSVGSSVRSRPAPPRAVSVILQVPGSKAKTSKHPPLGTPRAGRSRRGPTWDRWVRRRRSSRRRGPDREERWGPRRRARSPWTHHSSRWRRWGACQTPRCRRKGARRRGRAGPRPRLRRPPPALERRIPRRQRDIRSAAWTTEQENAWGERSVRVAHGLGATGGRRAIVCLRAPRRSRVVCGARRTADVSLCRWRGLGGYSGDPWGGVNDGARDHACAGDVGAGGARGVTRVDLRDARRATRGEGDVGGRGAAGVARRTRRDDRVRARLRHAELHQALGARDTSDFLQRFASTLDGRPGAPASGVQRVSKA